MMNERQEKERFVAAIDHTLTSLEGDPFLYQRVKAHAEKGETMMKHRWTKAAVIALIAVLCMGTVAVAGGWVGGFVNWKGEMLPDTVEIPHVMPTPAPEMTMTDFRRVNSIVSAAEDLEIVTVWETNQFGGRSSTSNRLSRRVEDFEQFTTIMADAPQLPVPGFVPEGYELAEGQIFYACTKDGRYELTSSEELEGGLTVERYRVADEHRFICGYDLTFRRPEAFTDYITIHTQMHEKQDPGEHHFGLNADQTAEVLTVAGMDDAILISSGTHKSLNMRRTMPEMIGYRLFDAEWQGYVSSYAEVDVTVMTRLADLETCIRLIEER